MKSFAPKICPVCLEPICICEPEDEEEIEEPEDDDFSNEELSVIEQEDFNSRFPYGWPP